MNTALHDRVLAFIDDASADRFADIALATFAAQYESIPAYRAICDRRAATPHSVQDWRAVPPVPALAFKSADLRVGHPERVFLSSGTTEGSERRSRHAMPDLRLYHRAALRGLREFVFPDIERMRVLSLIWPATERPESSLAQMADWAIESFGSPASAVFVRRDQFEFDALVAALRGSEDDGEPTCILTTTGTWLRFLDFCRERALTFRLAHSSRLMDTGGSKGAPRPMSRNGLLRATWELLAIPGYYVVNEYGMTELSSQFYDDVIANRVRGRFAPRSKAVPHWVRTRALDPLTLAEVPTGELGQLCHFDLANAGSAACVLTEDLGRCHETGFEIVGRVAGAEERGCSLMASD